MEVTTKKCSLALLAGLLSLFSPRLSQASCWKQAGARYHIDPTLLKAIAWKESHGHPNAVGPKLPGGYQALGLMQINSVHLPILEKFGIHRKDLFDACVSEVVGAWILAQCMQQYGHTWHAVGCYYAGPASHNIAAQVAYARDVREYYKGYKTLER